jgi:hypothetical protein
MGLSCFQEESCSSSRTINPKGERGRKMAEPPAGDTRPFRHAAVVLENPRPEPGACPVKELWDEANLRSEEQHAASRDQLMGGCLEIHLRFP